MKKTKKFLAFVLAMSIPFTTISDGKVLAFAEETPAETAQIYSSAYYGGQLNPEQKAIYDSLLAQLSPENENPIEVPLLNPIIYFSKGEHPTAEEISAAQKTIQQTTQPVLDALLKDCPQIFWLNLKESIFTYVSSGYGNDEKGYQWTIKKLIFRPKNKADSVKRKVNLEEAIANFPVTGESNFAKLLSIHDGLAWHITYSLENNDDIFTATGALLDGKTACEGYSKAFKLLCEREGIPCVLVSGQGVNYMNNPPTAENHMWCYVQMEDTRWYAVDLTWDDQESIVLYDYFLTGAGTRASGGFGGSAFYLSHLPNGDFSDTNVKIFWYPALSQLSYEENHFQTAP